MFGLGLIIGLVMCYIPMINNQMKLENKLDNLEQLRNRLDDLNRKINIVNDKVESKEEGLL